MSNQTSKADIVAYLADVKRLLSAGKYDFVPRRKNMQALSRHGLTIEDAKSEILDLIVDDYYNGPEQDYDSNRMGDIWIFKKDIDGVRFYIKVKIVLQDGESYLKCIGFHDDYAK